MYTLGPAINFLTSSWLLPQKEQDIFLSEVPAEEILSSATTYPLCP
jgi:hypothetical protein